MDVQLHIRIVQAYVWTLARLVAEIVGYGIFHLVSHEHGVVEGLAEDHGIYRECAFHIHVFIPFHTFHGLIYLVGIVRSEAQDGFQYTYSRA